MLLARLKLVLALFIIKSHVREMQLCLVIARRNFVFWISNTLGDCYIRKVFIIMYYMRSGAPGHVIYLANVCHGVKVLDSNIIHDLHHLLERYVVSTKPITRAINSTMLHAAGSLALANLVLTDEACKISRSNHVSCMFSMTSSHEAIK